MKMSRKPWLAAVLVGVSLASGGATFAGENDAPASGARLSFTARSGLAFPRCHTDHSSGCWGDLGLAPALQALVLYAPNERWRFGLAGQLTTVHWQTLASSQKAGDPPFQVDSDLVVGFVGLAARYAPWAAGIATPIAQLSLGASVQHESGRSFSCNGGLVPTAQFGVGGQVRIAPAASLSLLVSVTNGFQTTNCDISDAVVAPFVGWGYGLLAGVDFDLPLARRRTPSELALR